jgi:hypothetical protein
VLQGGKPIFLHYLTGNASGPGFVGRLRFSLLMPEEKLPKYKETKSRNSIAKDYGGKVQVRTTIPENTCHPGENVNYHTLENPRRWACAKCGSTLLVEKVVNEAFISDKE